MKAKLKTKQTRRKRNKVVHGAMKREQKIVFIETGLDYARDTYFKKWFIFLFSANAYPVTQNNDIRSCLTDKVNLVNDKNAFYLISVFIFCLELLFSSAFSQAHKIVCSGNLCFFPSNIFDIYTYRSKESLKPFKANDSITT